MSKKTYIITKVIVVIVVCLVVGYASWLSLQKVGDVYLDETERAISEIKQNFLKTTVENIIREIDVTRDGSWKRTFTSALWTVDMRP
jgi:cell division protein YceG involved in septum cleavage